MKNLTNVVAVATVLAFVCAGYAYAGEVLKTSDRMSVSGDDIKANKLDIVKVKIGIPVKVIKVIEHINDFFDKSSAVTPIYKDGKIVGFTLTNGKKVMNAGVKDDGRSTEFTITMPNGSKLIVNVARYPMVAGGWAYFVRGVTFINKDGKESGGLPSFQSYKELNKLVANLNNAWSKAVSENTMLNGNDAQNSHIPAEIRKFLYGKDARSMLDAKLKDFPNATNRWARGDITSHIEESGIVLENGVSLGRIYNSETREILGITIRYPNGIAVKFDKDGKNATITTKDGTEFSVKVNGRLKQLYDKAVEVLKKYGYWEPPTIDTSGERRVIPPPGKTPPIDISDLLGKK